DGAAQEADLDTAETVGLGQLDGLRDIVVGAANGAEAVSNHRNARHVAGRERMSRPGPGIGIRRSERAAAPDRGGYWVSAMIALIAAAAASAACCGVDWPTRIFCSSTIVASCIWNQPATDGTE